MAGTEKQFNAFIKGLITEATALTFPANASLDEDNCVLNKDGSRQRRLGVDYEDSYSLVSTGYSSDIVKKSATNFYKWDSPGGNTDISVGIVRVYEKLWFMNLLTPNPSSNLLNAGTSMTISGLGNNNLSVSFINNLAVCVSSALDSAFVLVYDSSDGRIYQENIPILVRDIWGVSDGLSDSERPSTLSTEHNYNLISQGWNSNIKVAGTTTAVVSNPLPNPYTIATGKGLFTSAVQRVIWTPTITKTTPLSGTAIETTKTALGVYPSNSDVWTLGKVSDSTSANYQQYDPNVLSRNSFNNIASSKGSAILDIYNRGSSRRNATGLQTLPLDKEAGRCSTVASYASRVFYSGIKGSITSPDTKSPNYGGYIFFSQIVTTKEKLSLCYQAADPTSPDISDIIDTDGGTIQIPEITHVVKLIPTLSSLLVCAENGIWEIFGDAGGFKATSFQTSKVTSNGVLNANTIVEVNGTVFVWGNSGIMAISPDPVTGRYKADSITLTTIQTRYNSIPSVARLYAKGYYSQKDNVIRWLYNDRTDYSSTTGLYHYNRELVLDLTLKAFYPTSVSAVADLTIPYISDYVDMPGTQVAFTNDSIVVDSDPVILLDNSDVGILIPDYTSQRSIFKFLVMYNDSFTLGSYKDSNFVDWKTYNNIGFDYLSYLVTGYDIAQDLMRKKEVPHLFVYFDKTETGFNSSLNYLNPSSCFVQSQWNWTNTATGNKWGKPFQAYKFARNYQPSGSSDTFDDGDAIVVSRNKLRGSGKSLSLKFYSETGKDMRLLGWAYPLTADTAV